jgi:hypothetical protein
MIEEGPVRNAGDHRLFPARLPGNGFGALLLAGVLILETLSHAKRRGARNRAELAISGNLVSISFTFPPECIKWLI